jgi:hypothetical protein
MGPTYALADDLLTTKSKVVQRDQAKFGLREKDTTIFPLGHRGKAGRVPLRKNFVAMTSTAEYDEHYYEGIQTGPTPVTDQCHVTSVDGTERWLADTGATTHITTNDTGMTNVENVSVKVLVGDGKEVVCRKRGDITIYNGNETLQLRSVLYTKQFAKNIVSVGQILKNKSYSAVMQNDRLSLVNSNDGSKLHFKCNNGGVLFYFNGIRQPPVSHVEEVYDIDNPAENVPISNVHPTPICFTCPYKCH